VRDDDPFVDWGWVVSHLDDIATRTFEHLYLTAIAVGAGLVLAIGLSMVIVRNRSTQGPITWLAGVLYTIPSLALFAVLVPFTGLSVLTAEIGLVSYTLLILIRNIVAGLDGVPAATREAALGMGYTRRRILWEVEVPLALPVIVAGIRIATVTTIGLVTVTSLIGQGGLGFFILQGLRRFFTTEIVVGTVLSVVPAVCINLALVALERRLTPWARAREAT
jgi:osmoprotectant transport system permease protein